MKMKLIIDQYNRSNLSINSNLNNYKTMIFQWIISKINHKMGLMILKVLLNLLRKLILMGFQEKPKGQLI